MGKISKIVARIMVVVFLFVAVLGNSTISEAKIDDSMNEPVSLAELVKMANKELKPKKAFEISSFSVKKKTEITNEEMSKILCTLFSLQQQKSLDNTKKLKDYSKISQKYREYTETVIKFGYMKVKDTMQRE